MGEFIHRGSIATLRHNDAETYQRRFHSCLTRMPALFPIASAASRQQVLAIAGSNEDEALAERGLLMSDRHFQLSATLNGVGVSLFVRSFIQNELEKGTLVCPLALEYHTDYAYYLARSKHLKHGVAATRFYEWILSQALEERPAIER